MTYFNNHHVVIRARDWHNPRSIGLVKFWRSFTHFYLFCHKCKVRQKIKDEYCIILIALDPVRDSSVSMSGRIPLSSFSGSWSHPSSSLPSSQSLSLLQINSFWKFYIINGVRDRCHRSESGFAGWGRPSGPEADGGRWNLHREGRRTEDFPPVRPPQEWNRTADPFITSVPWALVRMRVRKTILILFLVDATFSDLSFERCFTFKIEMRIATLITRHQVDCIGIAIIAKISYAVTKIEILFIIFPIKWMLGYQF